MQRLRASVPPARMARYDHACRYDDEVDGLELYVWARSVALAAFDDLGHVEVAMRSAMATKLADEYGLGWYDDDSLLDDSSRELVDEAKSRCRVWKLPSDPALVHGKVVATLMFGFWVKLLGRGAYRDDGITRTKRIYDTDIWKKAVRGAFPNVGDLERQRVETVAKYVQSLRNRIAHHEHVVWGVPIAGVGVSGGNPLRLALGEAHEHVFELAGFLNNDLESWLRANSSVQDRIEECPISDYELSL